MLGDLDANGTVDIVAAESGGLVVHLNHGEFSFESGAGPVLEPAWLVSDRLEMAAYDATGDGHVDVVGVFFASTPEGPETFAATFAGDGEGHLLAATPSVIGADVRRALAGARDLTGDGAPDIAMVEVNEAGIQALISNGDGEGAFAMGSAVRDFMHLPGIRIVDGDGTAPFDLMAIGPSDN